MNPIVVTVIIIIGLLVVFALVFILLRRKMSTKTSPLVPNEKVSSLSEHEQYEMRVKFEDIPALTEQEETQLVEIKDSTLLARLDNVIPDTLRILANNNAVKAYNESPIKTEPDKLFQAIIPKGGKMIASKQIPDTYIGGGNFPGSNGIDFQTKFRHVDLSSTDSLANIVSLNSVMAIASMVVGQYYMSQINSQLDGISSGIEKIADFQQMEIKSKVYALVAEVQKASTFQVETIENDDLRNRELSHMKSLEHECAQLLGQANLSIQGISDNKNIDYKEYEKLINDAEIWFQYQQILLDVMFKIADLTYVLNIGAISRANSYALYQPYATQSEGTLKKLKKWHSDNVERLKIDVAKNRRKRQGIEGFFMGALGLINDDFNYKKISQGMVNLLENQTEGGIVLKPSDESDLFQDDVRLIAKDGKLYYLPNRKND